MIGNYQKPNPICAKCRKEMRCVKNGVIVDNDRDSQSRIEWHGDMFRCGYCGAEVISQFGEGHEVSTPRGNVTRVYVDNL